MAKEKTPEELLEEFRAMPDIDVNRSDIEVKVLTTKRAEIISQLADFGYKPAGPFIFDYLQRVRLTTEKTAAIAALGRLGYTEAIPYIERDVELSERWYNQRYKNRNPKGLDLIYEKIVAGREALVKLQGAIDGNRK